MITINLLKRASRRKTGNGSILSGVFKTLIVAVIVIAAIFAGVAIMYRWSGSDYSRLATEAWYKVVAPKKSAAVSDTAPASPAVRDSTLLAAKEPLAAQAMAARNPGGTDAVPAMDRINNGYAAMSPEEKADYEMAFAGRVFHLLAVVVPAGIEFNSLTVDSFATLSATGRAPNRECAADLFNNLVHEKITMLTPPHSFIQPVGAEGYRFQIESRIAYEAGATDSTGKAGRAMPRENLPSALAGFSALLRQSGLAMDGKLACSAAEKSGAYTRFRYAVSGRGSYPDFVKLIAGATASNLPCAFRKITITGQGGTLVRFDADIAFITVD